MGRKGFTCSSVGKESACNAGDPGLVPGSGRSPGEGNGNPLQYSCLENPMDGGAWRATVHGVATRLKRVGHDLATKPPPPQWVEERQGDNEKKGSQAIHGRKSLQISRGSLDEVARPGDLKG